jgi:hypothetical protein
VIFESDSNLHRIEYGVFTGCYSLVAIGIPASLRHLDGSAFRGSGVSRITIDHGSTSFVMRGDFLLDFDEISLIHYFGCDSNVLIPGAVKRICCGSFYGCDSISSVQFEDASDVVEIEPGAFSVCSSLTSISSSPPLKMIDCSVRFGSTELQSLFWFWDHFRLKAKNFPSFDVCSPGQTRYGFRLMLTFSALAVFLDGI